MLETISLDAFKTKIRQIATNQRLQIAKMILNSFTLLLSNKYVIFFRTSMKKLLTSQILTIEEKMGNMMSLYFPLYNEYNYTYFKKHKNLELQQKTRKQNYKMWKLHFYPHIRICRLDENQMVVLDHESIENITDFHEKLFYKNVDKEITFPTILTRKHQFVHLEHSQNIIKGKKIIDYSPVFRIFYNFETQASLDLISYVVYLFEKNKYKTSSTTTDFFNILKNTPFLYTLSLNCFSKFYKVLT